MIKATKTGPVEHFMAAEEPAWTRHREHSEHYAPIGNEYVCDRDMHRRPVRLGYDSPWLSRQCIERPRHDFKHLQQVYIHL